jgi:nitrite reductase (NADH) small subunit
MNKKWFRITDCRNIPLREGRSVRIAGREVAIFNLGNRFLAVENRCPHRGGPLADGIVSGSTVVCPLHASKINLENGAVNEGAGHFHCVERLDVQVKDGGILLHIPSEVSANEPPSVVEIAANGTPPWMESNIFSLDDSVVGNAEV